MQISDMFRQIGQQNQNMNMSNVQGQIVQGKSDGLISGALSTLQAGDLFEGTIVSLDQGKVLINLANGESFSARMDGGVKLVQGEAAFFQVKSNDHGQIALKTVSQSAMSNPTLLNALSSAGVQITERTIQLVRQMMSAQLPIDKKSLQSMARAAYEFPNASIKSLVSLQQLKLPINEMTIQQLEHYEQGEGQISRGLEQIMEKLPETFANLASSDEGLVVVKELLQAILPEAKMEGTLEGTEKDTTNQTNMTKENSAQDTKAPLEVKQTETSDKIVLEKVEVAMQTEQEVEAALEKANPNEVLQEDTEETLLLSKEETEELKSTLKDMAEVKGSQLEISQEEKMEANKTTASDKLRQFADIIKNETNLNEDLRKIISSKEFKNIVKNALEEQWFMKPEQVAQKEELEKLFSRIGKQLEGIERAMEQSGKTETLGKPVAEVRSNLSFMNQVNQLYNYVQIPLKMINQNTNGELYVYTNKKATRKPGDEISAHLHLEMEHLGTTDVYVKLRGQKLSTNFVMADESSLELVMKNIDILTDRLSKKGYDVNISVKENGQETEEDDFVAEILGQESPKMAVSRYSFDVKV